MKILLVDPPALTDDYDKAYPNLGILQLISYLRERTALTDDDIVFLDQFHSVDDHLTAIEKHRPDIYGISYAFLTQRLAALTISAVKERFPDLLVIAGGPHPTSVPEQVLEETRADLACIGEGEVVLSAVVDKVLAGDRDFGRTPGLALRRGGRIVQTPTQAAIEDLDSLPYLAWERIDFSKFVGQHYCRSDKQSCIVISRGCPFKCTFCSLPVWRVSKPFVRMRSPANIAAEVDWLYRLGVREIKIVSDEINVTLPWAKEVCRAIADLGHQDLYFQSNLRADKIDDELAHLFERMNMWLVHLGMESANDRVLGGIEKHITVAQTEQCLKFLKKHRIRCLLFMMAFNLWEEDGAVQCERPAEVLGSLRWAWGQFLRGRIAYMTWSIATPMPGAPLYDIVRRHGLDNTGQVLDNWGRNKDYLGIDLRPLGITERTKMRLLRLGILSRAVFMIFSGQFDWRRHFYRVGILVRSFFGNWKPNRRSSPAVGPVLGNVPLRAKVEG
ncbi:MAG: B12-binding domain-containing radical SAM protein [bacterium]|nr:B12-binding domain-containing radical SAM protein [bacterium]